MEKFSTPTKSPQKLASKYFNLFPKDFHRPYGLGCDPVSISEDVITKRLNRYNCYWFSDPKIAVSTLASTLTENTKSLVDMKSTFEEVGGIDGIIPIFQSVDWNALNNRVENPNKKIRKNIRKLESLLLDDDQMATVKLAALVGANLYLPSIHLIVARHFTNLAYFKDSEPKSDAFREFLKSPTTFGDLIREVYKGEAGPSSSGASRGLLEVLGKRKH